jgi:hypothetical protein
MATSTGLLVLTELAGHAPAHLEYSQQLLAPFAELITYGWIAVWCVTGLYLLWVVFFRKQK